MNIAYAMGSQGGGAQGSSSWMGLLPLVLLFVVFYFLLIRPQQKKQKDHRQMLSNLQKGDVVITQGGLHGKVTGLTDTVATLEIAEKVRVKIQRGYIAALVSKGEIAE